METIFMNNENSKTSEPHRFKLDLIDKLNLKNPNKNMDLANLSIYYTWKNINENTATINVNSSTNLELYFWFTWWFLLNFWHSRLLWIYHQKARNFDRKSTSSNLPNKIKNRIVFIIKTGYKLELLTPETMFC